MEEKYGKDKEESYSETESVHSDDLEEVRKEKIRKKKERDEKRGLFAAKKKRKNEANMKKELLLKE